MADRFYEHPLTVLVVTNMLYSEAPWLHPRSSAMQARLNWLEVPLEGSTAYEFDEQISDLEKDRAGLVEDDSERAHGQSPLRDSLGAGDLPPGPGMAARAGHPPEGGLAA